ncbi:MAG: glycyl-radical enzyme activating protein [Verrucomicrobia bacterium]|nr:glycyl-radical enzyme activating protein [Verrucomicrobiota bacterium]
MERGLVFNIQKFSVHDGPGIRTTVFLKGCPLRCAWCHNPEGRSPEREILFNEDRCLGCGQCREACPHAAQVPGRGPLPVRHDFCQLCGACVAACPTEARQMAGRERTVAEVMAEVVQDRVFYEDSGGGVTFSGGEPLMQPGFLKALLEASVAEGLHTAVDTCGYAGREDLLAVAPWTGLFLFDVKLMDSERHRRYTGVPNATILDNLRALDRVHDRVWVRVPLIPGLNDQPGDLEAIARFAASLRAVRQVNLLPYHKSGLQKSRRLGQSTPLEGLAPPSPEQVAAAVDVFRAFGHATFVGG